MLRWLFALVAIAFSPPALAAELEFLRGSTVPAYTVPQMAPQLPDAAPLSAPLGTARPFVLVQPIAPPPPLVWNWTGFYIGANAGLAFASTNFADPFGASVFGDTVRSPGSMAGGQIGFNWQAPGWQWVFGVEADGDAISSDGTSTCFAASALTINATCRVRPQSVATLTGRIGYAMSSTVTARLFARSTTACPSPPRRRKSSGAPPSKSACSCRPPTGSDRSVSDRREQRRSRNCPVRLYCTGGDAQQVGRRRRPSHSGSNFWRATTDDNEHYVYAIAL